MSRAFVWACVGALSFIGLLFAVLAFVMITLPDVRLLQKPCFIAVMNNIKICKGSPSWTPLNQISLHLRNAVIISEDAAFYSHGGIDADELRESIKKDVEEGRFARGASTITQQLAKNVFFNKEKTLTRKLMEVYAALQIEKALSKSQILELYLNVVEFGNDIYGVKQAAQFYFSKSPGTLEPQEAAFLTFLLPNPTKYSQSYFKRQLTPFARQMLTRILTRLAQTNHLTPSEYDTAIASLSFFPWKNEPSTAAETQSTGSPSSDEASQPESDQSEDDFQFEMNEKAPSEQSSGGI